MSEPLGQRVLVVDDEDVVRNLIALVLRKGNYAVAEAPNGRVALERLEEEAVDLVITDLNMPEMDGGALLKECRALYPDTDVMVLTAHGTIRSAVEAMKYGAVDYITKPFGISDLTEKVSRCFKLRDARVASPQFSIQPLVELNRILASELDLQGSLDAIVDLIQRTFRPTHTEIAIFEDGSQAAPVVVRSGQDAVQTAYRPLSRQQIRYLAQQPQPWLLRDGDSNGSAKSSDSGHNLIVPLTRGSEAVGALTLSRGSTGTRYTQSDAQLLGVFCSQIALSMLHLRTHQRLVDGFRDLNEASLPAVQALFEALGTFDRYTRDHSERVSRFARMLGGRLRLSVDRMDLLSIAGLLHDIGKLGVGDGTLRKNGSLTEAEFDKVRLHPVMGARILAGVEAFAQVVPMVLHHHEQYDGQGYPDRLAGEDIPLGARIIAVVDTYDSMTSDRPYRSALTCEEAKARLRSCAGTQLDRHLAEEWTSILESGEAPGLSDPFTESEQWRCTNGFSSSTMKRISSSFAPGS